MTERFAHVRMDDGTEVEVRWGPGEKFVLTVDDRSSEPAKPETAPVPVVAETPPAEGTTQVEQRRDMSESVLPLGGA